MARNYIPNILATARAAQAFAVVFALGAGR
jgi:hypothetical protein